MNNEHDVRAAVSGLLGARIKERYADKSVPPDIEATIEKDIPLDIERMLARTAQHDFEVGDRFEFEDGEGEKGAEIIRLLDDGKFLVNFGYRTGRGNDWTVGVHRGFILAALDSGLWSKVGSRTAAYPAWVAKAESWVGLRVKYVDKDGQGREQEGTVEKVGDQEFLVRDNSNVMKPTQWVESYRVTEMEDLSGNWSEFKNPTRYARTAALGVSQALEKAQSLVSGNILSQEDYNSILQQTDVRDRYPFTVALVEHEIRVAEKHGIPKRADGYGGYGSSDYLCAVCSGVIRGGKPDMACDCADGGTWRGGVDLDREFGTDTMRIRRAQSIARTAGFSDDADALGRALDEEEISRRAWAQREYDKAMDWIGNAHGRSHPSVRTDAAEYGRMAGLRKETVYDNFIQAGVDPEDARMVVDCHFKSAAVNVVDEIEGPARGQLTQPSEFPAGEEPSGEHGHTELDYPVMRKWEGSRKVALYKTAIDCALCGLNFGKATANTCILHKLVEFPDGEIMEPIRYGDPREGCFAEHSERCHDCNVAVGGIHHRGCDVERCPRCFVQIIGCACMRDTPETLELNPNRRAENKRASTFWDMATPEQAATMERLLDDGLEHEAWELLKGVAGQEREAEAGNSLVDLTTEKANEAVQRTGEYSPSAFLTLDQIDAGMAPCGKK